MIAAVVHHVAKERCEIIYLNGKKGKNTYHAKECKIPLDHAVQILLIASVRPTSLVSNSYKPTDTPSVASRRSHVKIDLMVGTRYPGK